MIAKEADTAGADGWQKIAAAKKAEQVSRIPSEWKLGQDSLNAANNTTDLRPIAISCGILSARELLITGGKYDASSLAAAIAEGSYTAVEVVTAFCKRAAIGHQLCNNLTEIMFADAIEDAKSLDKIFQQTGKTVGPLHGLPMTFKVRRLRHLNNISVNKFCVRNVSMSRDTMPVTAIFPGPSARQPRLLQ